MRISDWSSDVCSSDLTGMPKGAMNEHRGVVNRQLWMRDEYGIGPGDTVLQKTPFRFDVSVWEFFLPLLSGAPLVMARPDGNKHPACLAYTVQAPGRTPMPSVTSLMHGFL